MLDEAFASSDNPFLVAPFLSEAVCSYVDTSPSASTYNLDLPLVPASAAVPPSASSDQPVEQFVESEVDFQPQPGKRQVGCQLLHNRLGHRSLAALMHGHKENVWNDVSIQVEPETRSVTHARSLLLANLTASHRPPLTCRLSLVAWLLLTSSVTRFPLV